MNKWIDIDFGPMGSERQRLVISCARRDAAVVLAIAVDVLDNYGVDQ